VAISPHLEALLSDLRALHIHLHEETHSKYQRINPFYEDLFDWKERGAYWIKDDKDITIYNSTTVVGDVEIGEHTWIGPFCSLDGTDGIKIGHYCSISAGCHILTHDTVKWALSGGKEPYDYAPVHIGDCCFFGVHAVVTKGVTIGEHCLIGAGAIVTKDIPPFSIAGGVPARQIGKVQLEDGKVGFEYCR